MDKFKRPGLILLIAGAVVTLLIDIFILHRHSHFAKSGVYAMDGMNGFYAILAFIGAIILVGIGLLLGRILQVEEDYYHDDF